MPVFLAAPECALAQAEEPSVQPQQPLESLAECLDEKCAVEYRPKIEGVKNGELKDLLESASQLFTLEDTPPRTTAGLRRRAEGDLNRLRTALKSEAYYLGEVSYRIDQSKKPAEVVLQVAPGPIFKIRSFRISPQGPILIPEGVTFPEDGKDVGMAPGMPARGPDIVAAQARAVARVRNQGYPFAKISDRRLFINIEDYIADVRLMIDLGGRAYFGPLEVSGLGGVDIEFIEAFVTWKSDELFDQSEIAQFAQKLENSGLFSSVRVRPDDKIRPDGKLPVIVELKERKRRTIGVGLDYSTSEGPGATVFWEHRNLAGEGEKIRVDAKGARIGQALKTTYEEPQFFRADQKFLAKIELATDSTDAFDATAFTVGAGVERQFSERLKASMGTEFEYARTEDDATKTDTFLLTLPLSVSLDTTNDLLNPKTGFRLSALFAPSFGFNDGRIAFRTYEFTGSAYQPLDKKKRFVLATRARIGVIEGASTPSVPARKRFYSGGGGSLRAFAFQEAGPLTTDASQQTNPDGGRGVLELGLELRINVTETIGIAPFLETGAAFDKILPGSGERLFSGAGLGAWYVTPVGPIRVDLAFPLARRSGIDKAFQVYVSLGQSF